jgi:hypothetical protein
MRKGFLHEEKRKYLTINEEVVSHICLCTRSLPKFLTYEENFLFLFTSVDSVHVAQIYSFDIPLGA